MFAETGHNDKDSISFRVYDTFVFCLPPSWTRKFTAFGHL